MKVLKILILALALVAGLGWMAVRFFPEVLATRVLNSQANAATPTLADFATPDGMTLIMLGTGSPLPGPRAQSGLAIVAGDQLLIFDVGDGIVQRAEGVGLNMGQVTAVFITHWHSDHFIDLPNLINRSWVMGRPDKISVNGPTGLTKILTATDYLLAIENQYRVDHHGPELMDLELSSAEGNEFEVPAEGAKVVYERGGVRVSSFAVDHSPINPAVGYVVEYLGKRIVISGDTVANENLTAIAQGADVLVHEVMLMPQVAQVSAILKDRGDARNARITTDIQDYHTSPQEAAAIAEEAGVGTLVFSHFVPAPDNPVIAQIYRNAASSFTGELILPEDGQIIPVQ